MATITKLTRIGSFFAAFQQNLADFRFFLFLASNSPFIPEERWIMQGKNLTGTPITLMQVILDHKSGIFEVGFSRLDYRSLTALASGGHYPSILVSIPNRILRQKFLYVRIQTQE